MLTLLESGWCQMHSTISVGTLRHRVGIQNKTLCNKKGPCGLKKNFTHNITRVQDYQKPCFILETRCRILIQKSIKIQRHVKSFRVSFMSVLEQQHNTKDTSLPGCSGVSSGK